MTYSHDELRKEAIIRHRTQYNTLNDFPVGTEVQIITPSREGLIFFHELGYVKHVNDKLIEVTFHPIDVQGKQINSWYFKPEDLKVVYKPSWIDRFLNKFLWRK